MLYAVTEDICSLFSQRNVRYTTGTLNNMDALVIQVRGQKGMTIELRMLVAHEGKDIALMVNRYAFFEEDRRDRALELINQFHQQWRYLRFILTDKGEVIAQIDLPQAIENAPEVAFECYCRMIQILDSTYPQFMKAAWG